MRGRILVAVAMVLVAACSGADDSAGSTGANPPTEGAEADQGEETTGEQSRDEETAEETTTTVGEPVEVTIVATGDFLLHMPVHASAQANTGWQGHDFSPMLEPVAHIIGGADLAICHMETPLSGDDTDLSGFPMFNASGSIAHAAAEAGFDGCSTASNHSLDRHMAGVVETLDVLDGAGLGHAGTARTAEEAEEITFYGPAGVSVAHLAYTYDLNGLPLPEEAPWAVDLIDTGKILDDAQRARAEGADIVAVSMHWGNEYQAEPSDEQLVMADELMGSGLIDVIFGAHAHVVQPVEVRDEGVVFYGMGNFLSNQVQRIDTLDGMIAEVTLTGQAGGDFSVTDVAYTPTRVDVAAGHLIRPVDPGTDPESFERTRAAVEMLGAPVRATTAP